MATKLPNFRGSLMGFHKGDVMDYLTRMETEMEMYVDRLAAADKTMAAMKSDMQTLNRRLEALTEENCRLETGNAQLRKEACEYDNSRVGGDVHQRVLDENRELKDRLEQLEQQIAELTGQLADSEALREACEALRAEVSTAQKERKSVQDALISAQRMGQIVIDEARQEAERITAEARQAAGKTLSEARQRNDALQASYDRMLMDTGKMKSELIELYRRHLALLAEIPGRGEVPVLEEEVLETVGE